MYYHFYLFLLPTILAYDCQEICNITVSIKENTSTEKLKWNLIDLLSHRTSSFDYLQFSLSNPSEYFQIETPILKFRLLKLDREEICNKMLFNDQCSLQLQIFTQTSFIIIFKMIILDENDWKPVFNQNYIQLNIRENLPIHYRIQLPIAYDYDSIKYNIDHYEFLNNTEEEEERIFQLEKSHDELRLKLGKQLDCELKNNYQLYIIAIDKGGFKSNVLHVNITVGDLNEYQPRFSQRLYHTRIPENLPIINSSSSPVFQITAIDDDCHDKTILYSLINNDIPNEIFPFVIDNYSGLIKVNRKLDYETISTYRFRVKASNLDQITSSMVPIIIDILDVNDNQPIIQMNIFNEYKLNDDEENFVIIINENIRLGQVIGTILIRDIDSIMINQRLSLKILSCLPLTISCPIELYSGIGNNTLSSTTYLIRTSRQLDREMSDEKFIIIFEARKLIVEKEDPEIVILILGDYGQPSLYSQRRLFVNINDENDCSPKFTQLNYQFRLSNSSPIGFLIGRVQANDEDDSPNFRLIQYKLLVNDIQDIIKIDSNNGSLYLIKQLSEGLTLNMTVMAIDQQNHSLYDQAKIQIISYDETTCLPMFAQQIYVFNTTEHQITPYEIGQVNADNCLISSILTSYHLVNNESALPFPFLLDSDTGKITVIHDLDREIKSFYKFQINLLNHNTHQSIQTEIHINILDENDHSPIFNNSHKQYIYINIKQNNKIFITHIHATDADGDVNGIINYYFTNKDNYAYFHLYSNGSIVLYNSNNLHLPYRLEIYARDQGYPRPLNSNENLVIYICDLLKRTECPSNESFNKVRRNFYLGSIFIMISVVLFLFIIIICIVWNLFANEQSKRKENQKSSMRSLNCQAEAKTNLIVSDSLNDDVSPNIDTYHRFQAVIV